MASAAGRAGTHRRNRMRKSTCGRTTGRIRPIVAGGTVRGAGHARMREIGGFPGGRGMAALTLRIAIAGTRSRNMVRFCRGESISGGTDDVAGRTLTCSRTMIHGRRRPYRTDGVAAAAIIADHRQFMLLGSGVRYASLWRSRARRGMTVRGSTIGSRGDGVMGKSRRRECNRGVAV